MNDQELEVKFLVTSLDGLRNRLEQSDAELVQARTHELNLRFDTPDLSLTRSARALRLRQDTAARLTYKGPAVGQDGARLRQEIEFIASDFRAARAFLEALGYQISIVYEKYRTVYDLQGAHIALDELPYGNFVEIEGPDTETLRSVNAYLGLRWEAGVPESYTVLFERVRQTLNLPVRDLTFENFQGISVSPRDLNAVYADER